MELCVPVTDIFRRNQNSLLPLVGAVSFKEPTDEEFPGKVHMLECSLNIASPTFGKELQEAGLADALRSGRFTSFACDIGPAFPSIEIARSANGFPRYVPNSPMMTEEEYFLSGEANLKELRSFYQGQVKLENLNYFPTGGHEMVCEAGFTSRLIGHLGVELLLDIGHVVVTARNLKLDVYEYLEQLPLDTVSEIQVSGSLVMNGVVEDSHELPSDEDLNLVSWVVKSFPVRYATLEYYKDDEKLVAGYEHLTQILVQAAGVKPLDPNDIGVSP